MNIDYRKARERKIESENFGLAKRIFNTKATLSLKD